MIIYHKLQTIIINETLVIAMGVPVFFKWLTIRNPKIIRDAVEPVEDADSYSYSSTGNPLIDNFYIDMNGLIHPSVNPKGENIKIPTTFQEQCQNIYQYIDKLINIVRPKKCLYLAIDGVAPRAKMNQQRSRRFRAALEGQQSMIKKQQLLQKFKQAGAYSQEVENYATKKGFDSNMITPGTQFLSNVCNKLRQYIRDRLQNHKLWKNLTVVFSDANCPGEGEHKIMDFIRQQRSSSQYTPNQSHCIYGADADLIMLALATHQPKFYIIRQVVITANDKYCTMCMKKGHFFLDCKQATSIQDQSRIARQYNAQSINVSFQFIRIQMVRQFIHINYMKSIIPFGYDLQRIIDDFVFMCFFVGNDFLPHIPCLNIREGGIDVLMRVYEYCLGQMTGYITNAGKINFDSLRVFVQEMKYYEESLVKQMVIRQVNSKQRQQNNRNFAQRQRNRNRSSQQPKQKQQEQPIIDPKNPLDSFKAIMQSQSKQDPINLDEYSVFNHSTYGYKQKFYRQKFKITPSQYLQLKSTISRCYLQSLQWICGYYYRGVQSWSWFYPFHYSPFFTDITIPNQEMPDFQLGNPFKPFQQLMAVLPPRNCSALPQFLHYFMKDITSPIIDFYPQNFHIDLVGKKFAWLGQVILPFIDEKRLLKAISNYQDKLTQQQAHRNRFGFVNVYINKYGPLGRRIRGQISEGLGANFNLSWEKGHDIQGEFTFIQKSDEDFIGFAFEQPLNRKHEIALKGYNNPLQQINEEFILRTDRAAFGGLRYVKLVQSVMSTRKQRLRKQRSKQQHQQEQQYNKQDRGNNNTNRSRSNNYESRQKQRQRSRSRQKNPNRQRPHYYDNNPNSNYERGQRNNYNNNNNNYQRNYQSNRNSNSYDGQRRY